MHTVLTDDPEEAARFLNRGELVAFPTETVYGLGADAFMPGAAEKIFSAKGRPRDNPLIIHIAGIEQITEVAERINEQAADLINRFFPGPLTVILRKKQSVPDAVTAGLPSVGVRCPSHPIAGAFLGFCTHPVAAPSANISGRPSSTDWETVFRDLDGKIRCILRGQASTIGLESTIVDCTVDPPLLLRTGAVSVEELLACIPSMTIATSCRQGEPPKSPGMKYRHYSPAAAIVLFDGHPASVPEEPPAAYIGLSSPPEGVRLAKVCSSPEAYARDLFGFFRNCDAMGVTIIYCGLPPDRGIGRAIRDRLEKAAGKQ
jgi:L-threonylcarbamoyladenylate synthase